MNRKSHELNRIVRNKALAGAIVAALALCAAGTASAQSADYGLNAGTSPWSQTLALNNYLHSVNNTQSLFGDATAALGAADSISDTYAGSGAAQTVSSNTLSALAVGNNATGNPAAPNPNNRAGDSIDMGLLDGDATNSGLGILSGQLNNDNKVTASVSSATVSIGLTGYNAGAVTANSNAIRADAVMNDASSTISGDLPSATFAGVSTTGTAQILFDGSTPATAGAINNAGDISIGNAQVNSGTTGSGAGVTDAGITVTDSVASAASFSNSDNAIAGSYVGNRSANSVNATGSDGAPVYNGSVVVSNGQANLDAPATTAVTGSTINTTVDGSLTGAGSITQSGDSISASTQGNTANNAIAFAQGINIDGTATMPFTNNHSPELAFGPGSVSANASGDLVLVSVQGNQAGTRFTSTIEGNSGIEAIAGAASTTDSAVTLQDDHMQASSGGNTADNTLSAHGTSFSGYAAAGSQQVNDHAGVAATVTGAVIRSNMTSATTSKGDIAIGASSIAAGAEGNQSTTNVSVSGDSSFNAAQPAGTTALATTRPVGGNDFTGWTRNAGISAVTVQANYGNATSIAAANSNGWLGALYAGGLSAGSSTVDGNNIDATADGNAATTDVALAGGTGVFTAGLVNQQYNANAITGSATGAYLGIQVAAGGVGNTALTVHGNDLGAGAYGNQGSNSLSTDFTNATLGGGQDPWSAVSDHVNTEFGTANFVNTAFSIITLASTQFNDGNTLTATATNDQAGVQVLGGNVTAAPTTVDANAVHATAVANQVGNAVAPGVGNLASPNGTTTKLATLSNVQYANDNAVSATVSAGGAALIGAQFAGTLSDSGVTVSSNDVAAFAAGSMAANGMAVTGTNYVTAATSNGPNPIDGQSVITNDRRTLVATSAAFSVQNVQDGANGSRMASVANGTVGAAATGNVSASPMTVDANQIGADARDNYATNALSLAGFSTLTTTAVLQNMQASGTSGSTPITSTVDATYVAAGSLAGTVTGSDVTVSGNGLTARAIGNTATSTFSVDAAQLSGNGATPSPALHGAVLVNYMAPNSYETISDYDVSNVQYRNGGITASVTDSSIGAGSAGNFNGGSLTVADNAMSALAQSNSASNNLGLNATSTDATAALLSSQIVDVASDVSATTTSDEAFAAYVGGALGTATVVPVTVSDNSLVAQAGLNTASNALNVHAGSAIDGSGIAVAGATTDTTLAGFVGYPGAQADYAANNMQTSGSGATATANAGLVGIEVADGGIGRAGTRSGLTVDGNQVASQASANDASNAINLTGASSVSATTALSNTQTANAATFRATTSNTSVGIYDDDGSNIREADLDVSGNRLSAAASGNSASNAIAVLPVALNAGSVEATLDSVDGSDVSAVASHALLNSQNNAAAINATVSNSNIGVDSGAPGGTSPLMNSVATVGGNSAMASASGNSASNAIMLASLSTGVASSALVSNQINTANITATVSNVHIGVNAGAASTSPVTVSGNTISATAVGNSATNHIGIGN